MPKNRIDNLLFSSHKFEKISFALLKRAKFVGSLPALLGVILNKNITLENVNSWYEKNLPIIGSSFDDYPMIKNPEDHNLFLSFIDPLDKKIKNRLYRQPGPKNDFDIRKESILSPDGDIPRMFMYTGYDLEPRDSLSKLNLDLAHNEFLVVALSKLFYRDVGDEQFLEKVSRFLKSNINKVNNIKKLITARPKLLGKGEDGVAFSIGNNLVLKILKNETSYNAAKDALNRLHKNHEIAKTEAMVYDVGVLGHWPTVNGSSPIYYTVLEEMKPATSLAPSIQWGLKNIIVSIMSNINDKKTSVWRDIKKKINNSEAHALIKQTVLAEVNEMLPIIYEEHKHAINVISSDIPSLRENWVASLIEEIIMKYLTSRTDLHLGNIGITNYGEFRYFDPAFTGSVSEFNNPKSKQVPGR